METLKIWLEKEKAVHVIIAGLLISMALVIGVVPNSSRDAAKSAPSAFPARSDMRDALAPVAGLPTSAARFAAARPLAAVDKPVTLDEFFGLLEKSAPASAAQKFKQEFLAQPVLRKELESFRKEQGGTAAAHEFVQRIVRLPEFRDMLGKFKAEGGSAGAFLQATHNPQVASVLRQAVAAVSPSAGAAGAKGPVRRVLSAIDGQQRGAGGRSGTQNGAPQVSAVAAGPSRTSSPSSAAQGAVGGNASADGAARGSAAATGGDDSSAGGGATKLGQIAGYSGERNASSYLPSFFANASQDLKDLYQQKCDAYIASKDNSATNNCDIPTFCTQNGEATYNECKAACQGSTDCSVAALGTDPAVAAAAAASQSGNGIDPNATPSIPGSSANPSNSGTNNNVPNPCTGSNCGSNSTPSDHSAGGELVGGAVGGAAGAIAGAALFSWTGPGAIVAGAVGCAIGTVIGAAVGGWIGSLF